MIFEGTKKSIFFWFGVDTSRVKIAAPQEVVSELQKEIQRMRRQYFADDLEMELAMKDNKC